MLCRISCNAYNHLLQLSRITPVVTTYRSIHLIPHLRNRILRKQLVFNARKPQTIVSASFIRHSSNTTENVTTTSTTDSTVANDTTSVTQTDPFDQIPEPPAPVELPTETLQKIIEYHANGEPTFASIGLGGWSPVGLVQSALEWMHITFGMPWWQTVVVGTVIVRLCMFPIAVISQRYIAKMNNSMPEIQLLQKKMMEARQAGDNYEAAMYANEMLKHMKEKEYNPMKSSLLMICQAPVWISWFLALRGMGSLPVESLKEGGLFWFKDLTVCDPYYILPILTCTSMFITLEIGADGAAATSLGKMRYVMRAAPVIVFPFIMNFQGIILCYWVSTNLVSIVQVSFLRLPRVRAMFGIPKMVKHEKQKLALTQQGFMESMKDSFSNMKVAFEMKERNDIAKFQAAGRGPLQKTYKYNPVKLNLQASTDRKIK